MAAATHPSGLIDTDILIDAARKHPAAESFLVSQQHQGGVALSVVSAMELMVGCRDKDELRHVKEFLSTTTVVPISDGISFGAMDLVASFWLSHGLLLPDALIAATARNRGLKLCTKNRRHFQMIPDLVVVRPY